MERVYYVYLLTSRRNGTLCCGVTNNIRRRVQEHKSRSG
ncbi:MAG: GIY-YIG nuclease family protein, partial [Beijerinckiaceae bacterium]